MMAMLLLGTLAFAADFQIHVMSSSVLEQYYQSQTGERKNIPLCDSIGEQLIGCVWGRQNKSSSFKLLHVKDVSKFGASRDEIWKAARLDIASEVTAERYRKVDVDETPYVYWASNLYDGFDAAALLHPDILNQFLPLELLMAIPAQGTVLFWESGIAERDKIIAVGVYDIYHSSKVPVSPDIYKWDGERWLVWARGHEQAK